MIKRTVQGTHLSRAADIIPSSIDLEARELTVCFTTGAKGRRFSWSEGIFNEELEVSEQACDLTALNAGAPVLKNHDSDDEGLDAVVGRVLRGWIEGGLGYARLKFDDDPESEKVWRKVSRGFVTNVSVGYQVHQYQDVTQQDDKIKTYRAIKWTPREISPVPIGFDIGAQVRSGDRNAPIDIEIIESRSLSESNQQGEETMPPKTNENQGSQEQRDAGQQTKVDLEAAKREAAEAAKVEERQRAADIRTAVRAAKLDDSFGEELITKGTSVDEARKLILERLATKDEETDTRGHRRIAAGDRDDAKIRSEGIENALLVRAGAPKVELTEAGKMFRGMSLLEMGDELLSLYGQSTRGLSKMERAGLALSFRSGLHTTSDFANILAAVANKTLRAAYEAAPQTFRPLVRVVSVPDFKQVSRMQLGDAPNLEKVNEHGEFKRGTLGEGVEKYQIATYGKVIGITRQVIVNDDLDAFSRVPMLFGRAAADLESDLVWGIITGNVVMGDGNTLFHANHKNLGTGGAISDTTLSEAREKMRKQTGLNGRLLNITATYLVVPAALETKAQTYLATEIRPTKAGDVNPFAGSLQLIVEPRLDANSATAWYEAASPAQIDTIELAYLQGNQGVYLETRQGFDVDGVEVKCRLDVGAAPIDYRGFFKNAGV